MKPDWKDAPKKATWLAQDESGEWCFGKGHPVKHESCVGNGFWAGTEHWHAAFDEPNINWRDTLEPRPEVK